MSETTPRRRGRPARGAAAAEDARARIVRAARELFVQLGYQGVSMRAVAERAGCSAGALYTAFPNKRALLRHIWELAFAELLERLKAEAGHAADPLDRLRALLLAQVSFWRANPDHFRAIFLIEDEVSAPEETYFVESSAAADQIMALILEAIGSAQSAGALRPGPPAELLEVFFAGLHGVASLLITVPEFPWSDGESLPARTIDILLRGAAA
ncbi:TetR/AcrR family transcriptional regulator [Phenylobacterium soli]|uniref:TetR/AcrR family transcriptional regulator n=1 Tax=Phenylobacterium soli TaxID=2170551 RepID=A0A328AMR5_9CAUL|nr:TetR/AcrR family transcriptional regulator [Phenylobacterium soli]RAK54714.1 TetR/AcrR family transcriptional regulator [Phenylobacterium soli]